MSARTTRIERLLALTKLMDPAWERAHVADDVDEMERVMVRKRAVSAAIAEAVAA